MWIFSWSQVLDDARRRLAFLQELIDHRPDDDEAMAYLREHHAGLLPESIEDQVASE